MRTSSLLRRETGDTLRQTGAMLFLLLLIPLVYAFNNARFDGGMSLYHHFYYGGLFVLAATLLVLARFMFERECSDGAMEYLKTLPLTPARVLWVKVLPRLVVSWLLVWLFVRVFFGELFSLMRIGWMDWELYLLCFLPPALLMAGGFLYGVSGRKGALPALMLLIPVLYSLFRGQQVAKSLLLAFLRRYAEGISLGGLHAAHALAIAIGVLLPPLLSLLALMPLFRQWQSTPEKVLSERIVRRAAIPTVLLLALFLIYR
jgi:ABC-type transport system involved in cytochrome c biogenesis permease component